MASDIVFDRRSNSLVLRKAVYLTVIIVSLTAIMRSLEGTRKNEAFLKQEQHRWSKRQQVGTNDSVRNTSSIAGKETQETNDNGRGGGELIAGFAVTSSTTESTSTTSTTQSSSSVSSITQSSSTLYSMESSSTLATRSTEAKTNANTTLTTLTTLVTEVTETQTSTVAGSSTSFSSKTTTESDEEGTASSEMCEEPAYHEFPSDIFGNQLRAKGAVIIHILVGIYMFYALAIVCDEYFVASMEKICDKMHLSEDVAGATFMAAGSSAPELFASILGVFVAKGDVGTGTIVGSAVFNLLFVIGFCAVFCGKTLQLTWWTIWRDSVCYAISVFLLIVVMFDGVVTTVESFTMLVLYSVYIVIVKYSFKLRCFVTEHMKLGFMDEECTQGILTYDEKQIRSSYVQFNNVVADETGSSWKHEDPSQLDVDEIIRDYPRKMSLYEAALKMMTKRYFRPYTRFRYAAKRIIVERRHICREGYPNKSVVINETHYSNLKTFNREMSESREAWKKAPTVANQGLLTVVVWFVRIPVLATLHYTIPDCRNAIWERYFLATFFVAMLWIAIFSYILVWMITLVGYTFGIPDTVMGITFLAAGTSVPDAYTSLLLAKQGMGDMAIANSIGSNVFDILVGLALPWFFRTAIYDSDNSVPINSRGLVYNVLLLLLSIIVTVVVIHRSHWQLNQRLGYILLVSYAVFLFFSVLIEYNVFGFVNLPECDE